MKKLLLATALTASMFASYTASAAEYVIDTKGAHASVNFAVSHLGYSFIKGRFNSFEGEFSFDKENVEASKINVTVDTRSLDSNHAERDKHIRSSDFINAQKFGTATFQSTKVTDHGDGKLLIDGDMTLHGVTKPISIDATFIGEGQDPWGGYRAGFEGSTRIELEDFGIPIMGTSSYVDLELHVEGVRK